MGNHPLLEDLLMAHSEEEELRRMIRRMVRSEVRRQMKWQLLGNFFTGFICGVIGFLLGGWLMDYFPWLKPPGPPVK